MAESICKDPTKKNRLLAKDALKRLQDGNKRFLNNAPIDYPDQAGRGDYDVGQKPYAAILCCSDSRVAPEVVFNAGLDELFVIRVAGNIATTEAIASIEYAVLKLNTNLIVVLGHECCGAVSTALDNADNATDLGYNLNSLIGHLTPAVASAKKTKSFDKDPLATTIKQNAKLTAQELRNRSPIIAKARGVQIASAYYRLIKGDVRFSRLQ